MDDSSNFTQHFIDKADTLIAAAKPAQVTDLPQPTKEEAEQIEQRKAKKPMLPRILPGSEFPAKYDIPPAQFLIDGMMMKNDMVMLSGPSKAGKSFILTNIGVACAAGLPIFNRQTRKCKVLQIDFELRKNAIIERVIDVALARGLDGVPENFHLWSLNRETYDLEVIIEGLKAEIFNKEPYDLVILDPAYCIDTKDADFDENSNRRVTMLMQSLDELVNESDATLMFCHHVKKGDPNSTSAIDRASGAGAWARYPSLLMTATHHEEQGGLIIETISRNFKPPEPFCIELDAPLVKARPDLNPAKPRKYGESGKPKMDPVSVIKRHLPFSEPGISKSDLFAACASEGLKEQDFLQALEGLCRDHVDCNSSEGREDHFWMEA